MKERMIVLRGDCGLERTIKKRTLIVLADKLEEAVQTFKKWNGENRVFCVVVREERPLPALQFDDEIKAVPLALYLKEGGSPGTIIGKASEYRESNLSLFLPAHRPENFILLQILSSLGVSCGVYIENEAVPVDWERMNDLMYYVAYSRTNHAPVDPFSYVVSHYDPEAYTCFTAPWFEDPKQFVHMDSEENIALSQKGLEEGDFIAKGESSLDTLDENEKYNEILTNWKNTFIDNQRCASCPAWRVCGGVYYSICEKDQKYFQFFNDLLEAAEQNRLKQEPKATWRL